jgi:hypothetical protein
MSYGRSKKGCDSIDGTLEVDAMFVVCIEMVRKCFRLSLDSLRIELLAGEEVDGRES